MRGDARRPQVAAYATNRFMRIVPGFWFWLLVTIVVAGTAGSSRSELLAFAGFLHIHDQPAFTDRMVQAWTLDVEIVFYLAVPLIFVPLIAIVRHRGTPAKRAGALVAGCIAIAGASALMGVLAPRSAAIVPGSAWSFALDIGLAALEPVLRPRVAGSGAASRIAWMLVALSIAGWIAQTQLHLSGPRLVAVAGALSAGVLGGLLLAQWSTDRAPRERSPTASSSARFSSGACRGGRRLSSLF